MSMLLSTAARRPGRGASPLELLRMALTLALAPALAAGLGLGMASCGSPQGGPSAASGKTAPEAAPEAGPVTATAPQAPAATDPAAGAAPAPVPPSGAPGTDPAAGAASGSAPTPVITLPAEVQRIHQMLFRLREKYGLGFGDLPPNDPRRQNDETYREVDRERRQLVERYAGRKLAAADHLILCQALFQFGAEFHADAAAHCEAYATLAESEAKQEQLEEAIRKAAIGYFDAGKDQKAEENFTWYLASFCGREGTGVPPISQSQCRIILNHYLPEIHHRTGNLGALERLLGELKNQKFNQAGDLKKVRQFLIEDLWKREDLSALETLCGEVLREQVWESASPTRELVPAALSALARIRLLLEDCNRARQVYLDYEFEHISMDPEQRQVEVQGPAALICQPAPMPAVASWYGPAPPKALFGRPGAPGKPVLLHFFEPGFEISIQQLRKVIELAKRNPETVQVIGLIPLSNRHRSGATGITLTNLKPEQFREATGDLVRDMKIPYPLGILDGGASDPTIAAYRLVRLPALVLVGPLGEILAFHPQSTLDEGWDRLLKSLARK